MGLQDDLRGEVSQIFSTRWDIREGRGVPDTTDLKLGNDGMKLSATVLYADIDGSTAMVDSLPATEAAEIYKAYLRCAARIVRSEEGQITAYDGDRIMAVFIGESKNTQAVRSALKIKWAVSNIINPGYKAQYHNRSFSLSQVVGVDTSELLIARTGIRGANDLVWVGRSANYAAKLGSISEQPYSTMISAAVYEVLHQTAKYTNGTPMWESRSWKGQTIYRSSWMWEVPNS